MRLLFAPALLFALSLASCGESETDAYRTAFRPVNLEIVTTGRDVEVAIRTAGAMKNNAEVAVAFARLTDDAARIAGSLVRITAPSEFTKDHRSLIRGLRQEAGHLHRISRAAIDGDVRAAQSATADAAATAGAIRTPRSRIVSRLGLSVR